jgi:endonuclease III
MKNDKFVRSVIDKLVEKYGSDLSTELVHKNSTELFVAVLLSPQCTDKQVNKVTLQLFKRFRTFDDYANADIRTLMKAVSGLNYYKTKARNLKKAARMMVDNYNGVVPQSLNQLMEFPGVGRKVANVVLNEGFAIDEGIAVDTHCVTVARRLKLSRHKDANKIEIDLMRKVPRGEWGLISNLFIALGRDVCTARVKYCEDCALRNICPSSYTRK